MPMHVASDRLVAKLADPALAAALSHFVRARVPESEVKDIVQATLTDALDAPRAPDDDEEINRWVHGICRHKVIDWFRRTRREVPRDLENEDDGPPPAAADSAPVSAMDLLRWAKKELPPGEDNEKTLEWMLREGAGEKLEAIAAEANLPAPRVRQRVSRLRRHYKMRWAAQAAALAALLLIALAIAFALRRKYDVVAPAPGPSLEPPSPTQQELPPPEAPAQSTEPQVPPPAPTPSALPDLKPVPTSSPTEPAPRFDSTPAPKFSPPAKPQPPKASKKAGWGSSIDSSGPSGPVGSSALPLPPDQASSAAWGNQK